MKKNTVKLFILAAMLGGSLCASAQSKFAKAPITENQARSLKELSAEFTAQYEADYAEAVKFAEANNLPLIIKGENGSISRLTKIKDGIPFYTGTYNVGSALTSRTNALQVGGSLGLNLTGEYENGDVMLVGIWDGGYPLPTHADLIGRTSNGDTSGNVAYHPTHVTGTVIGNGNSASTSKGMATNANTLNFNFDSDAGEMAGFAAGGYILSNHSYGTNQALFPESYLQLYRGTYDDTARQVDRLMFDAPYYQPVFAAGNDGDGTYDRLTDSSLSKNGIAVAAIAQVDSYVDASSVHAADFTSYGPSNDNRIKPDISSKGLAVYSCSNTGNTAHAFEQGTSMAAPGITGSLTLLQQYYSLLHETEDGIKHFMRSATVRALVAHCADEAGDAPGPDPKFGWGLMNAKRFAEILAADKQNTSAKIQELVLMPGTTYTYQVNASGTEPLIATLSWTDPAAVAGANGSAAVVQINNLDITVTNASGTHYPWRLSNDGSYIAVNDGPNNVDNIEKVEVPNASGTYTITISHKKTTLVNPGLGAVPSQEYSLVVSGITSAPAGLEDVKNKMFSVWPNPASNIVNISFADNLEKGASAAFYDVQGRLVKSAQLTSVENTVDVQDLAKGLYMVSITNGGKTEVEKVIIK